MKAVFICRQGALAEGPELRCTLRCGAAAGLRMMADLDFRLIVIDEGRHVAQRTERSATCGSEGSQGRPPDNGRRRRRTDHAGAAARTGARSEPETVSASSSLLIYRLGDLLFREQLVLQGYYSCSHQESICQESRQNSAHLAGAGAVAAGPSLSGRTPCFCHPPQPGLLLHAGMDHGIDLSASWMIGARLDDVEAGNRAGCRTVLIDNGIETSWRLGRSRVPTRIAPDLYGAARLIWITQK